MKKDIAAYLISGSIILLALFSTIPLLGNEDQNEWFAIGVYQLVLLASWCIFFAIFLMVAWVLSRTLMKAHKKKIFDVFKISIVGTSIIVGIGNVKSCTDFDNWDRKSRARQDAEDRLEALKYKSTVDSLKNIIGSDNRNSKAFFELGLAFRHHGEWVASVENYTEAIAIDSTQSDYHSELAYSLSFLQQYDEAIEHYERAYYLDSTQYWIQKEIGRCKSLRVRVN